MTNSAASRAQAPSYCIVLTATVNPNGMTYLALTEASERERQYLEALKALLEMQLPRVRGIVLAENSGADLDRFRKLTAELGPRSVPVELLSFEQNSFPRELGKGYGEFHLIDRALRESKVAATATHFVKLTGRLVVKNLARILNRLPEEFDLVGDMSAESGPGANGLLDTRLFAARTSFLLPKLSALADEMDDSRGRIAERVMYDAAQRWTDACVVPLLPCEPRWRGASGSHSARYDSLSQRLKFPYKAARRLLARLRQGERGVRRAC